MTACLLDPTCGPFLLEHDDGEIELPPRTFSFAAAAHGTAWTSALGTAWTISASAGLMRKGTGPLDAKVRR